MAVLGLCFATLLGCRQSPRQRSCPKLRPGRCPDTSWSVRRRPRHERLALVRNLDRPAIACVRECVRIWGHTEGWNLPMVLEHSSKRPAKLCCLGCVSNVSFPAVLTRRRRQVAQGMRSARWDAHGVAVKWRGDPCSVCELQRCWNGFQFHRGKRLSAEQFSIFSRWSTVIWAQKP